MIGNVISLESWVEGGGEVASQEIGIDELTEGKLNLDQILLMLTPRQREIVLLKMVGYNTNREVAKIMGMSISTIEKDLIRTRERLRSFRKAKV